MKKKVTNVEVILIIGFFIKILGLIYKVLLTRLLKVEGMRLISFIFPSLSLMLCLSSLSISTVVNQNISSNITNSSKIVKSAFNITFLSSTIISIIFLLSFPIYKLIYGTSFVYFPLLICIPLIYLSNSSGILKGYLEANNNFKGTYFSNFFEQIAKFLLTFSLLLIFKNISLESKVLLTFTALMLSEIVSFTYLVLKIYKKNKVNYFKIKTYGYEKNMLQQAMPLTMDQLILTITNYLEPLLFYYSSSLHGIDIYEATIFYTRITAYAIPLVIFAKFGALSIAKFSFPKIAKNIDTQIVLKKSFYLCFILAIFNLIINYFYPEIALSLLYDDYSASNLVKIIAPFYFFTYFNPILISILQATKQEKKLLLATTISSTILLISIFIFTYILGNYGLIIGLILSNIIKFILLCIFTNNKIKLEFNKKKVILLFSIAIIYFLINYLYTSIISLGVSTLICGVLALYLFHLFFYKKGVHQKK